MEPMNATALYTPTSCEVWGPTQNGEAALAAASEASGLPIAQCDVHKVHLGGGFGRRGRIDYVTQAVAIAKQMPGTPIKLIVVARRGHDALRSYHPVTQCKLTAGIDADGNVVGFHMRISGAVDPGLARTAEHARARHGPDRVPGPPRRRRRRASSATTSRTS